MIINISFVKNPMCNIEYTIIENSKSKGLKKGITIIFSFIFLIVVIINRESILTIYRTFVDLGSIVFAICLGIFFFSFKTYIIVGNLRLGAELITINKGSKNIVLELKEISYFDYKGYAGSYYPGDVVGTIVSHDGTGNILEIATNTDIYKLNCLIGDERSALALKNYVIKFNKSKQSNKQKI
jgi:hypothetical protein